MIGEFTIQQSHHKQIDVIEKDNLNILSPSTFGKRQGSANSQSAERIFDMQETYGSYRFDSERLLE